RLIPGQHGARSVEIADLEQAAPELLQGVLGRRPLRRLRRPACLGGVSLKLALVSLAGGGFADSRFASLVAELGHGSPWCFALLLPYRPDCARSFWMPFSGTANMTGY